MSKESIDELKKSIADYIALVYGETLESKVHHSNILEPQQKIVRAKEKYFKMKF